MTTKESHVTGHVTRRSPSAQRERRRGRMSSPGEREREEVGTGVEERLMRRLRVNS